MRHVANRLSRTFERRIHHNAVLRANTASSDAASPRQIAVLGSGITGLASAYYLTQKVPNAKITIFESSPRIGGWLLSNRVEVEGGSVLFEAGPRSLRPNGNGILIGTLVDELGLKDDTIFTPKTSPAANHRYIYYPDHLVRLPHPAFGIVDMATKFSSEPIFDGLLWSVVKEVFIAGRSPSIQDESIGDFLSRRLGSTLVDNVVSAVYHGIYAGDVYKLSAKSLMSKLWRQELEAGGLIKSFLMNMRASGSEVTRQEGEFLANMPFPKDLDLAKSLSTTSVYTFKEGLGQLIDKLSQNLWLSEKTEIRTDTKVSSARLADDGTKVKLTVEGSEEEYHFDEVVSALSPAHLSSITHEPMPDISSVTVMTVNLFYNSVENLPPGPTPDRLGFGYLIPRSIPFNQNPERALGVVFDHAYALPQVADQDSPAVYQDQLRAPGTKVTVMLGGHWWNDWPAYPDEQEGLSMAKSVLQRHLGITQQPEAFQVNLQQDCIPQYNVGHEDKLKKIHNKIWQGYKGRLRVAGNWIYGAGVNDCVRSSYEVVNDLAAQKDGTGLQHVGREDYVRVHMVRRPQ